MREKPVFPAYSRMSFEMWAEARENLAGAGGIEPCNNPLPHRDFSLPVRLFDSIFDSKTPALSPRFKTAIAGG